MIDCPQFKNRSGQIMLEMIVAISIILVGVVSTLTLAMTSIRGGSISKMQVTASNLAREGAEITRNLRDSNNLAIEANEEGYTWDQGLEGHSSQHAARLILDDSTMTWSLDPLNGNVEDCLKEDGDCQLYVKNGLYQHDDLKEGTPVPYYRLIYLHLICIDENYIESIVKSGNNCGSKEKAGIQVISEVRWTERGHVHSAALEDRIYNWRW